MSNRAFGVEIECYSPEGEDDYYGEYGDGVDYAEDFLKKNGFNSWAHLVSEDESLYGGYGVEIKSPILQGSEGFAEFKDVMNLLSNNNFEVDDYCGLHVHLDAPEFVHNNRLILKAVKAWKRNQHLVNNMVASNRIENGHCPEWDDNSIVYLEENLRNGWGADGTNRGTINVGSLTYHGSIEIRQHEGTLDSDAAIAWIKFCQAFIDTIAGGTVRKLEKEELLLRRLKVEKNASRFLTNKAARNKAQRR